MAVSQSQIVDLLYKQAFGVTKTDTATNKSPSNESIASPLLNRGDTLWTEADQIPGTAAALTGIVQAYTGANAVQCTADNTTVPIGGIYPTWETSLTYWIPSEFGSTYNVQVWVDSPGASDPTATGTQIFADGSGGSGQYYYNYQSGVLNFIGETIPAALTSGKVLYIVGYRYIGKIGTTELPDDTNIGNLNIDNNIISSINTNANIQLTPNGTGVVNSSANIHAPYFIGNISGNIDAAGANTQVQFNDDDLLGASANFTFNKSTNVLTVVGNTQANNANLGNLAIANFVNVASNLITSNLTTNLELSANTANFSGNVVLPSVTINSQLSGNYANFSNNVVTNNATVNLSLTGNTANFSGNVVLPNLSVNLELVGNTANFSGNVVVPNLTVNLELAGNTANFSGNIKALNANLGNLAEANYVNVAQHLDVANIAYLGNAIVENLTQNQIVFPDSNKKLTGSSDLYWIPANGALFSTSFESNGVITTTSNVEADFGIFGGNIEALNADLGNLATANYVNVAVDVNVTGNVNAGNLVGALANGTSNVKIFNNANVEVSIGGSANTATFASTGLYVVGEIHTTAGNMLSNGNVTANGFLNSANANVTGEAKLGSVLTSNITATTGTITISAAGSDQNITLSPTGTGAVDVGLHKIIQVGAPTDPNDAATKEYVDSTAQGLQIHTAANVTTKTNLTATYNNGGTVLSVTTIAGGKTITFSGNHGLIVDDNIVFTNSFNGIIGGDPYFVYSAPALNQITIKAGYFGAEVTTLTNATGLTQPALGNGGVGATLTNSGAQAALTIDSVLMTVGKRVLVQGQTNQFENGIYDVTTVGTGSTNWVLTRSVDGDSYQPTSDTALCAGSYFFVTQGTQNAGSSYVLTAPPGEIDIGTSNIEFSQFSAAGSYSAGNGIAITGTIISANTDNVTTTITGGNIIVKDDAQFVTPNIGAATGTSVNLTGNATANNLSIGNIANVGLDLTVGGLIQANGTISSNANVSGLNLTTTGNVQAQGNVLANNVNANTLITVPTANVSNIINAGNVTINLELSGNYANFSNTIVTNNATVNLALIGNTANFSGNVITNNLTNNLELAGNTANFSGNVITNNLTTNLEFSGNTANFSGNVQVNNLDVNLELSGNTANFTGNIVTLNANLGNLVTANFANIASNIITNNLTVNLELAGNTANFSSNVVVSNLTTNLEFVGNTANFSGNVVLPNLTVNLELAGNTANFTGNIKSLNANLGNLIVANFANVASNIITSNLSVNNELAGNTANFSGNVITNNLTTNLEFVGNTANFSGNVVVPNLTVNLELAGNTANFSGNIKTLNANLGNLVIANFANVASNTITNNLTVNLELAGNTANFSGNIKTLNANLGNLATANYVNVGANINVLNTVTTSNLTVNLELSGNTANFSGNIAPLGILTDNYYYANGSPVDFQQAAGSNNEIQFNSNDDFAASANLTFDPATNVLGVIGDANISNAVFLGNTTSTWATVTTSAITANQTIASFSVTGVTGIEYLVKGVDASGAKYSVATVQAVTNGTSVDYSTYGAVTLGGTTGSLAVNIVGGFVRLQVTPSSSNSTVWTTQYRLI